MIVLNNILWDMFEYEPVPYIKELKAKGYKVVPNRAKEHSQYLYKLYSENPKSSSPHDWDTWEEGEALREMEQEHKSELYFFTLLIDVGYMRDVGKEGLKVNDIVTFRKTGLPVNAWISTIDRKIVGVLKQETVCRLFYNSIEMRQISTQDPHKVWNAWYTYRGLYGDQMRFRFLLWMVGYLTLIKV